MLKRISSSLFQAPVGTPVQIVARARDNNGVNAAAYRYAQADLPVQTVQGLPGCSFTVLAQQRAFSALVVFDPGAKPSARYDLFEVDTDGTLSDMSEDTFPDSDPDISFSIEGIAAVAPEAMASAAQPKKAPAIKESSAPGRRS